MTNILDGLLGRIDDPALRDALSAEVERLRDTKDFGLVFERHLPENVRLYSHPVRRGRKVQDRGTDDETTWVVRRVTDGNATLVGIDGAQTTRPVEDLVVIRQFGEPIHPGFSRVGSIELGGDKPFHTVINAENYHALQTLLFTHRGKVDCIYIDPPYNTGAKDWKYNNDYVEGDDLYRHSKWLAFMERRLLLAKDLLNPDDSVLIVTIDEKEYLRLGMLLEQILPEARIQMISSVINPKGSARASAFARTDEYIFCVMLGSAAPAATSLGVEWKIAQDARASRLRWAELARTGDGARRADRPNMFYPVIVRDGPAGPVFDSVGQPFLDAERGAFEPPAGCAAVWPIRADGSEGRWQVSDEALRELISKGYAKLGRWRAENTAITYLKSGEQAKVESGVFPITGRSADNSVIVDASAYEPVFVPGTQWRIDSHNAEQGGTNLLKAMMPDRKFPFPKSLYAVEDVLRFFVGGNPNATIVDFFAGSGTTAHAVMRLNRQDGGSRRSIIVTNNEVSDKEAVRLRAEGLVPVDPEWEALGICDHITKPRIEAAITGRTPDGEPIKGDYKFTDEFPMADGFEENVEFLELAYLDRNDVSRGKAFEAIAPLLWMKVGAVGEMIDKVKKPYAAPDGARYAVLFDVAHWQDFAEAVKAREDITHLFVVTDSVAQYQQVIAELPATVEVAMLYEDYLRNFEINVGGAS